MDAAVAWRVGMLHQQAGRPREALEVYARAEMTDGAFDQAWLLAGAATAHWLLGDVDQALAHARSGLARASAAHEPRVLAAAHVALALTFSLGGDPATVEEHYAIAAGYAAEGGDLVQGARIEVNRAHHLLADARFVEAVEVASKAGAAAAALGSASVLAAALGTEAEGLLRLGRLTDARHRLDRALALAGEIGTRRTAGALVGRAQLHLRRGFREQARAALEQALRLTDGEAERQVRVPALAALAIAVLPDDVALATALAAEALGQAKGSALLPALLAAGRAAVATGDASQARELAARAVAHARHRRERTWLAEALELRAVTVDPVPARPLLREAHHIWQDAGAAHDADRVLVVLGRLPSASRPDRLASRLAAARLTAAGLADLVRTDPVNASAAVRIRTFGRFEVLVDGVAVPAEAWQSRRARELLRLLVCRRGRAMARMEICEHLWPDDDPDRTTHRLSVLLSIVRGVVGPQALVTDHGCVALRSAGVQVDVEQFLTDVQDGVALNAGGAAAEARGLLEDAVGRHTDEPFADAPYDDAATALRDEARAAYHQALRLLAEISRRAGQLDRAAGNLRGLLEDDRYDEEAHRALHSVLVQAGRHGQARFAAVRYRAAMADLGLRPAV